MCAEGTQVNVEPGVGSMYSILVNDEPITVADYGLFECKNLLKDLISYTLTLDILTYYRSL